MITAAILICLAPIATDGDTIKCANSPLRVRLFGVESPDKTPADAANAALLTKISAGGLVCELTGNSYFRTVARCQNAQGQDVSKQLLLQGTSTAEWCLYSKNYYGTCR